MKLPTQKLSLALTGNEPPSEFRLFTANVVTTTKGTFTFDTEAAASVMAEYELHGIDLALDYDHASLSASSAIDPANAGKAAGWFALELRNGELWATNVRWTPAAAEALRAKEWRFYSPAFTATNDGRITSLLNCALTNGPSTRRLEPLMAAGANMNPDLVSKALDALVAGDSDACAEILKGIIADAASGGEAPAPADGAAPAPGAKPKKAPPPGGEPDATDVAASLMRLTGARSMSGVLGHVQVLARENQALTTQIGEFDRAERRRLCGKLVTEAGQTPAQVWGDDTATKGKPHLERMALSELRQYVDDETRSAAATGKAPKRVIVSASNVTPPRGAATTSSGRGRVITTSHGPVDLSDREVAMCAELKLDVTVYATNKAVQLRSREAGAR